MPRIITRMFVRVKHSTFPWKSDPFTQHSKICCVAPVLPRTPPVAPSVALWGARFVRPPFVILQPAIPFRASRGDARKGISVPGKAKGGACLHPQSPIVFLHLYTKEKIIRRQTSQRFVCVSITHIRVYVNRKYENYYVFSYSSASLISRTVARSSGKYNPCRQT